MKDLKDRTAIVTGASRGIGPYIARALAKEGANLVLAARSAEALAKLAQEITTEYEVQAVAVPTDLTDPSSQAALIEATERKFGGVDVLVNNAGILEIAHFADEESSDLEGQIALNLTAPMLLTRRALPGMLARDRGHVVNVSSLVGKIDSKYLVAYASAKAGVISFSRSLRAELRDTGVSVSVVSPSAVDEVGMIEDWTRDTEAHAPRLLKRTSVSPDAVARAVVRSIKRDKAEVLVAAPGSKLLTLSPRFGAWMLGATGLWAMMRQMADHKSEASSADERDETTRDTAAA